MVGFSLFSMAAANSQQASAQLFMDEAFTAEVQSGSSVRFMYKVLFFFVVSLSLTLLIV